MRYAREQAVSTFKKVAPYILVGVGLGAVIHNWIPESWIETVLGGSNPFGVVLAVLVVRSRWRRPCSPRARSSVRSWPS